MLLRRSTRFQAIIYVKLPLTLRDSCLWLGYSRAIISNIATVVQKLHTQTENQNFDSALWKLCIIKVKPVTKQLELTIHDKQLTLAKILLQYRRNYTDLAYLRTSKQALSAELFSEKIKTARNIKRCCIEELNRSYSGIDECYHLV